MDTTLPFRLRLDARGVQAAAPVRLAADRPVTLRLRAGACIAVQSGRIWLTRSGDANDYVVDAGERHVAVRGGRVLVESLTPEAALHVLRDAPPARPGFP